MAVANGISAPDEHGNLNNLLSIKPEEPKATTEPSAETTPSTNEHEDSTTEASILEDVPKLNGSAEHEEFARQEFPSRILANLEKSISPESTQPALETSGSDSEKQVQFDEQTGRIAVETIQPRKSSIPDVAPPPYSASADAAKEPQQGTEEAAKVEAAPQKPSSSPPVIKDKQSTVAQLFSGR